MIGCRYEEVGVLEGDFEESAPPDRRTEWEVPAGGEGWSLRDDRRSPTLVSRLASVLASLGRATEVCHLYRCRTARDPSGPRPEPTEFVSVVEMPLAEAVEKVLAGEITAATTVLGLLMVSGATGGADGCAGNVPELR